MSLAEALESPVLRRAKPGPLARRLSVRVPAARGPNDE